MILIFNRYLIPVSIIDDTKVAGCYPQFNDGEAKEGWPASVFYFFGIFALRSSLRSVQMSDIRFSAVNLCMPCRFEDFSKRLQPLWKNNTEGARYFNAAAQCVLNHRVHNPRKLSGLHRAHKVPLCYDRAHCQIF